MKSLLIPFRNAAKLTFSNLAADKSPCEFQTIVMVMPKESFKGGKSLAMLKQDTKKEMVKDLSDGKLIWIYPKDEERIKRILLVPAIDKNETDQGIVIRLSLIHISEPTRPY
eukprot:TRINITY_DN3738_c0_g1_i4.p1 TRINITY_DN3738_c0_g1~~TRINITY_DN3738_c0_g1_i4.p1  ORF type:complete len:112 (+),score=24.00 TRINITY_DN3738_c0_g1_i4:383-718(+)